MLDFGSAIETITFDVDVNDEDEIVRIIEHLWIDPHYKDPTTLQDIIDAMQNSCPYLVYWDDNKTLVGITRNDEGARREMMIRMREIMSTFTPGETYEWEAE